MLIQEFDPEHVFPLAEATNAKKIVDFVTQHDGVLLERLDEVLAFRFESFSIEISF